MTILQTLGARTLTRVRARAYARPGAAWLGAVPGGLRRRLRLDLPDGGAQRLEIGSGHWPHPGYVHADVAPDGRPELLVSGTQVPLPDGWAERLLAVHVLEHVRPPELLPTLREWHRLLAPGGTLELHVPNGDALARALLAVEDHTAPVQWAIQNAVFGYWVGPEACGSPDHLTAAPDHKVLLTFGLVEALLEQAGFAAVEDVTGSERCHHLEDWAPLVEGLCLEVRAVRPASPTG